MMPNNKDLCKNFWLFCILITTVLKGVEGGGGGVEGDMTFMVSDHPIHRQTLWSFCVCLNIQFYSYTTNIYLIYILF